MKSNAFIITETEPAPILRDFSVFIKYLEEHSFTLTKNNEFIPRKHAYKINQEMIYSVSGRTPGCDQTLYPIVHLFYHIAISGKLFDKVCIKGGRYIFKPSERIKIYHSLTSTEKYFFLLETLWIDIDWRKFYITYLRETPLPGILRFLERVAEKEADKKIILNIEDKSLYYYLYYNVQYFYLYFSYFGFWEVVKAEIEKEGKHNFEAESIRPSYFGITMLKILNEKRNLLYWNVPFRREKGEGKIIPGSPLPEKISKKEKKIPNKKAAEAFFLPFISLFPEGELKKTLPHDLNKFIDGTYIFKVSLHRTLWRRIKISAGHSLLDLHNSIQEAYDFDDDHLYAFFMDGKICFQNAFKCRDGWEAPYVDEILIGELDLFPGRNILYLFDYGDEWRFKVSLEEIIEDEAGPEKPLIIEKKGENPPQYR